MMRTKGRSVPATCRSSCFLLALVLQGCALANSSTPVSDTNRPVLELLRDTSRPVFAPAVHRGNLDYAQGNSLVGIEASARAGALLIEIDLRRNRAGSIFLFHDRRLNQTNFAGDSSRYGQRPEELDPEALRELCYPNSRVCAPTLKEVLQVIAPYRSTLLLDIKNPSAEFVAQIIESAHESSQEAQILVQCQNLELLRLMRSRYPKIAVLARAFSPTEVTSMLAFRPEIVQTDLAWTSPALAATIHQQGARWLVKADGTEDKEARWIELRERGVDLVLTDHFKHFSRLPGGARRQLP